MSSHYKCLLFASPEPTSTSPPCSCAEMLTCIDHTKNSHTFWLLVVFDQWVVPVEDGTEMRGDQSIDSSRNLSAETL